MTRPRKVVGPEVTPEVLAAVRTAARRIHIDTYAEQSDLKALRILEAWLLANGVTL